MGMLSEDERYSKVVDNWNATTTNLRGRILPGLDKFNPIRMMTDSGARGSAAQDVYKRQGYNYADAVLISEKLVKEDVYTSIHIEEFESEARETKLGPEEILSLIHISCAIRSAEAAHARTSAHPSASRGTGRASRAGCTSR